jgi:hypothetical protein
MNKKDIISLVIAVALIVLLFNFNCNGKSSLEFEEVKFNTPEKVVEELGIKDLPKFSYVGNTANADFNWDYWDCLVEFKFEDTLSLQNKENIIKQVSAKDTLHWKFKDIPEEGVAEFYNIRYSDTDTIPYNIVITNDKVYVAYDNKVYYPDLSDIFSSNDYRLLAERTWLIGPDSSHEYVVKFNLPYSHYIKELRKDKTIEYKETGNLISITKNIYSKHDSDYLQAKYEIEINKKKNTAFIKYGTY